MHESLCVYLRSYLSKHRLCLAEFLELFFQAGVRICRADVRALLSASWENRALHGICTVTQKEVILTPLSESTTEIAMATMSSTCGRLEGTESPKSRHANKTHSLTLVLIYQYWSACFKSCQGLQRESRLQFVTDELLAMTRGRMIMVFVGTSTKEIKIFIFG